MSDLLEDMADPDLEVETSAGETDEDDNLDITAESGESPGRQARQHDHLPGDQDAA